MSYLVPNWSAPAQVKAFSTTRLGGISLGDSSASDSVYSSMNLALHVGDQSQQVATNRHQLSLDLELPSEPIWLQQVHSALVVSADMPITSAVDGSFSKIPNIVCAVMTADCLPLLLSNQSGDQVAAVHVGWRGLANGIIDNAIATFSCPSAEILAWAGPCIGPTKFEIDEQVKAQLGGPDSAYSINKNNRLTANLYALCKFRLEALGVINYWHSQACTYSDQENFFSYRRDGQCGRMASLIWLDRQ
jgi:YfiH family protein